MSHFVFDYPRFLASFKLYAFETVSTLVILILLIDFAIKEVGPALKRIRDFFRSP